MAITGGVEIADLMGGDGTSKELAKLREIVEKNNVKDLAKSKETEFTAFAKTQNKTNLVNPDIPNPDKDLIEDNALDVRADRVFDAWLFRLGQLDAKGTLEKVRSGNGNMSSLQNEFNQYLKDAFENKDSEFSLKMQLLKEAKIKAEGVPFTFELESLSQDIISSIDPILVGQNNTPNSNTNNTSNTPNTQNNTPNAANQTNKPVETRDKTNTYNYVPETVSLTEGGEANRIERDYNDVEINQSDIEPINIFKKGKLWKYMDEVLHDTEFKDNIYNINLGAENGLAGLILYIEQRGLREKIQSYGGKHGKFFEELGFTYKRKGGWDDEEQKIYTILSTAAADFSQNKDGKWTATENTLGWALLDFATEAKGYGFDYEKRVSQGINFENSVKNADEKSILALLCDFNGDGKLGVKYFDYQKRKEHQRSWKADYQKTKGKLPYNRKDLRQKDREAHKLEAKQKKEEGKDIENQGDVGTIFGPQLYDAIQTASNVLDVKMKFGDEDLIEKFGNIPGENIVIYNIFQKIEMFNTDSKITDAMIALLKDQSNKDSKDIDPKNCTAANLLTLCQQYKKFQPLFAKAIETLNGSNNELAPDLVDSLVGIDMERMPEVNIDEKEQLWKDLDAYCTVWAEKNPVAAQKYLKQSKDEGFVQMKKGIMTIMDNVDFSAMANDAGKLLQFGINKSRDVKKREHELKNSFMKDLFGAGGLAAISVNPIKGTIGLEFGQSGFSKNLKNVRGRNGGIDFVLGAAVINAHIGGEYARQFNYSRVVTANLADLTSSRYIGGDGGVSEIFIAGIPAVTTIEGGLHYKNDPKAAIEQMYKQYNDVSKEIFNIKGLSLDNINSTEKLEQALKVRYADVYKKLSTSNKKSEIFMAKFLDNNKDFLETNIKQISEEFGRAKVFEAVKSSKKPVEALDNILNIFQDGLTNSWRETMYERIAGKTTLSKVGIGVGVSFIANTVPLIYPKISLKIKHWRNNYIPVEAQKNLDASLMYSGGISNKMDFFMPDPPSVEAYGKYIEAILNIKAYNETTKEYESLIKTEKTPEGHLKISYTGTKAQRITDILDVRVKVKQKVLDNVKVSDDERSLIIGDVGGITAYTQSDGMGKRAYLILGGTTMENTCRLDPEDLVKHKAGLPNEAMTFTTKSGEYQEWKQSEIYTIIDNIVGAPGENPDPIRKELETFFDKEGKLTTPAGQVISDMEGCVLGDKFSTGTLTITKKLDGSYAVKLEKTPSDKFKLNYIQEDRYQSYITNPNNRTDWSTPTVISNLFDYDKSSDLRKAENEITTLYAELMELEDDNIPAYAEFLGNATNTQDGEINENELTQAIIALEKILGTNTKFTTIKTLLSSTATDLATRSYIVDRFKQVLAKEQKYSGQKISAILQSHGDAGLDMVGPSNEKISPALKNELTAIRNGWKKSGDRYSETPTTDKTLIGYTAFYRNMEGNKYENKKFSLTGLGSTSYQKMESITQNVDGARSWFLDNFVKQGPEIALLAGQITEQFGKQGMTVDLIGSKNENLRKLLKGEEISIDNGNKKVKLDLDWKFYLLGDCCNESIGVAITGIQVQRPKEAGPGLRAAEGRPEAKVVSSTGVAGRNLSSSMRVGSYGEEMGLNFSMVGTEKKGKDGTTPNVETQDTDQSKPNVEVGEGSGGNPGNGIDSNTNTGTGKGAVSRTTTNRHN